MKKLILVGNIIICALLLFGCGLISGPTEEPDPDDLPSIKTGLDTVFYSTLDELVENYPVEYVSQVMQGIHTEGLDDLYYYITYDYFDEGRSFPIAVIAFVDQGVQYYFSGAAQDALYSNSSYIYSISYSGVGSKSIVMPLSAYDTMFGCSLSYANDENENIFALSVEMNPPADIQTYLDVLSKITGDYYKQIGDGITFVRDDSVSISFTSYNMEKAGYKLSGSNMLREQSIGFDPPTEEIVNYATNPGEAGADLVQYPAHFYLELEVLGEGKTKLEILGRSGEILYSVDIEANAQDGAFVNV